MTRDRGRAPAAHRRGGARRASSTASARSASTSSSRARRARTRVRFTLETEPKTATDKLLESLGARGWMKRKLNAARCAACAHPRGRGTRRRGAAVARGRRAQACDRLAASPIGSAALAVSGASSRCCSSSSPPSPWRRAATRSPRPSTATPRASTSTSAS